MKLRSEQLISLHKIHAEKNAQFKEDIEYCQAIQHKLTETIKEKETILDKVEDQIAADKSEITAWQKHIASLKERKTYSRTTENWRIDRKSA